MFQTYENPESGERIDVDTNTIEGAWKHCKDHFKVSYNCYIIYNSLCMLTNNIAFIPL